MKTKPARELEKGDRINPDLTFRKALKLNEPTVEVTSVRKLTHSVTVSTSAGVCLGYAANELVRVTK